MSENIKFPKGFLWGAATSAHQVEGGTNNDWTQWEKDNAKRLAEGAGKKWEKWQQVKFPEMFREENYVSGLACDHYNRFEEDFDLAKAGGHNAHRFSIEWSRIEPEEGKFDKNEIEHYHTIVKSLRSRGIEPVVTLWHWTLPPWVTKQGGWSNSDTVEYFARYVEKIVSELKCEVKFWITLNEPNIYVSIGGIKGLQPPGKIGLFKAISCYKNLAKAHKKVYGIIHGIDQSAKVGFANSVIYFSNKLLFLYDYAWNKLFLSLTKGAHDFLGCNYFTDGGFGFTTKRKNENNLTDLGWRIRPDGIYYIAKSFKKYNLPIYITENGLADASDEKRTKFIEDHLFWLAKSIEEGCDVRGYLHWSLMDNSEFVEMRGFWPRFGLIEIDYKTLERKPRKSYYVYRDIIKNSR